MRAARGGPARALAASRRAPALRAVPRIAHGASPAAAPRVTLAKPLRLAVLNSPGNDPYAPLFERFVGAALADSAALRVASFETAAGQLPPLDDDAFDGFILSGSRHGAYEQLPWIAELLAWTRRAVAARKRLLGVCFGHQVIAQALGGEVRVNGAGFEIGGVDLPLSTDGRAYFARLLHGTGAAVPPSLRMLYVHGDAVCAMPPGFRSLGGSPLSAVNGMTDGDSVLTFQGHPEFSVDVVERLLPVLDARGLVPGRLPPGQDVAAVRASMAAAPADTAWLAHAVVRFFTEAPPLEPRAQQRAPR